MCESNSKKNIIVIKNTKDNELERVKLLIRTATISSHDNFIFNQISAKIDFDGLVLLCIGYRDINFNILSKKEIVEEKIANLHLMYTKEKNEKMHNMSVKYNKILKIDKFKQELAAFIKLNSNNNSSHFIQASEKEQLDLL